MTSQPNNVVVGFNLLNKAKTLAAIQALNPVGLQVDDGLKMIRFQLPKTASTQKAWQALDALLKDETIDFATPMLTNAEYPGAAMVPKNQIHILFKSAPSARVLETLAQRFNMKLTEQNNYDATSCRFELRPRPWREVLDTINKLHKEATIESAEPNYLRFTD